VIAAALLLATLSVKVLPEAPLIEQGRGAQIVNFDFLIENTGDAKVELTGIEMSALNRDGALVFQRRLQDNGSSIMTLPSRTLEPHAKIDVFNPFASLPDDVELTTLHYDFTIDDAKHVFVDVHPRAYRAKLMTFPLRGRVFVHDGHDFLSHHRRLDMTGRMTTALGISTNMSRYAYDFVLVDERGAMHKGDGEKNEDWFCFGTPVYAPADGVVVSAGSGDVADSNYHPDMDAVLKNVLMIGGNYVVIDHENGEFSFLAHMKQGSVKLKKGDRVKAGQQIGQVGRSGDAIFPHLHYQLQSDSYLGEGLPSYFRGLQRFNGAKLVPVVNGQLDTGDIVVTSSPALPASRPAAP